MPRVVGVAAILPIQLSADICTVLPASPSTSGAAQSAWFWRLPQVSDYAVYHAEAQSEYQDPAVPRCFSVLKLTRFRGLTGGIGVTGYLEHSDRFNLDQKLRPAQPGLDPG